MSLQPAVDATWWPTYRDRVLPAIPDQDAAEEIRWWVDQQAPGGELHRDPERRELERLRIVARALQREGQIVVPRFPRTGPAVNYAEYQLAASLARGQRSTLDWSPAAVQSALMDSWAFDEWYLPWAKTLHATAEIAHGLDAMGHQSDRGTIRALLERGARARNLVRGWVQAGDISWLPPQGRHRDIIEAWGQLLGRLEGQYREAAR